MSRKTLFCDGWEFSKGALGCSYENAGDWCKIDVPHDWLIYDVNHLYETSTGWYRKSFWYEKKEGMRAAIRFDGVYMDCRVYVGGKEVGEWKYGYSAFEFDITDFLIEGENRITVRVDYAAPNSRWYSGAGIFRNVWWKEYPDSHLVSDGIYITADPAGHVKVSAEIVLSKDGKARGEWPDSLAHTIYFSEKKVASLEEKIRQDTTEDILYVENPCLWDLETPHCYTLVSELKRNGKVIDREENRFGFRKIKFTPDRGFFLNDRHVKLHGACEHHDLGALGAAFNVHALRRKFTLLKEMGINAFRTSHNMPAKEFMELCDEMGFLVLSEGFDMWELPKTEYDYARFFPSWVEKDVASWVRRDRNHPSLIGWSIGNEIYDTHVSDRGLTVTKQLYDLVRKHDPRGNGYVTLGSNYMEWENAQKCADVVKLAGYNYGERLYEEHHRTHPDWMIYGSETSSVIQSRGIYHFPLAQSVLADDDEQCSALGNSATGWAAKTTEWCIIPDRDAAYCAGQFIWTGFDYIGESTPYETKNSYFGQFDTAGFAKDSAYIFRSEWTDYKTAPMVHLYPYWDFSPGQPVDVRVTSNAPKVALFRGGILVGEKEIDHEKGRELTMDLVLSYAPGELLAVAYDEKGQEIARDYRCSFGDVTHFSLTPDKEILKADGDDLIFVTIDGLDEKDRFVANANNRVNVSVTGAGRLVGLDNGDSTDFEQYKGNSRRLFSGKLLAIIGAKDYAGDILLTVSSPGLKPQTLHLKAEACERVVRHPVTENEFLEPKTDIPVRKIEFITDGTLIRPEHGDKTVEIKVYPENATYRGDIELRITTVLGIECNLAEILEYQNGVAKIRCKGDGEFYLRALCKNGDTRNHILAVYPFSAEGFGTACHNPYEFVAGGLFDVSNERAGNGIERGAGFLGGDAWFGYTNVDFGDCFGEEILLPIYANCETPVEFAIYDGIPGEGGILLGNYTYHKKPIWLTYQSENYRLNRRLEGIHTICFASRDAFHIKGFSFVKGRREREKISAISAKKIYGDKFEISEDAVLGIGNNVALDFGTFDFDDFAADKIFICGRSLQPVNSIHILAKGDEERRILAEFAGTESYEIREFSLGELHGKWEISFLFLPGSNFDFRDFSFGFKE